MSTNNSKKRHSDNNILTKSKIPRTNKLENVDVNRTSKETENLLTRSVSASISIPTMVIPTMPSNSSVEILDDPDKSQRDKKSYRF